MNTDKRYQSLGDGLYFDTVLNKFFSEKLEAEKKGFRIIGELKTGEVSGLVGERI